MNVLVINLTRFGDLLQTQPVILGLRAQGHRVGLLCLDNFAPAAALLDGVDYLAVLPGGALLANLDARWTQALSQLDTVLRRTEAAFPVDMVVNTTATLSARLLARRLTPPHRDILGFGMDAEGFGVSGDLWAAFLQGASAERINCPFNIVDMFRAAAQVAQPPSLWGLRPPDADALARADALLAERTPPGCAGFVAFQLGASEARRQWPVERFAALGARLWRHMRLCPILLGSPAERPLAEAYAACAASGGTQEAPPPAASNAAPNATPDATPNTAPDAAPETAPETAPDAVPFIDCVGATDVPGLAALLLLSRLLVSNDTGTMHLAAGLGKAVLGIFLATAQPWDTGPYLPDCCCLEPALPCHPCAFHRPCPHDLRCLGHISAATVFTLVRGYLEQGQWPRLAPEAAAEARAWLTCTDAEGFADLQDLSGHEAETRSRWLRMQRHFYRQILDGLNRCFAASAETPAAPRPLPPAASCVSGMPDAPAAAAAAPCAAPALPADADSRGQAITTLRQTEELLHLLCEQAALARQMPQPLMGQRLLGTCRRIHTVLQDCPPLSALGHLWLVLSQERGDNLDAVVRMAALLREHLRAWRETLSA